MRRCVVLSLGFMIFLLPPCFAAQDEAAKALDLVRKSYGSITGLEARFFQTDERPGIGVTVREEGVLSFRPPDLMRWDYEGKRPHSVVINGSRVWIYTPSRNQVIVRKMTPDEMRKGAATFLGGLDGLEEDFTVQSKKTAPGAGIPLDLFPNDENVPYQKISVLVSPDLGLIDRISIYHKLGNVTTITFQGIKTGVKLDDKLFEWDIPEGTEIIEP
jgi:outer membrane lipoprotein carrier protein